MFYVSGKRPDGKYFDLSVKYYGSPYMFGKWRIGSKGAFGGGTSSASYVFGKCPDGICYYFNFGIFGK